MYSLGFLTLTALLLCYALTPLWCSALQRMNLLDRPGGRHRHSCSVPRLGGVPVAFAYFAAVGIWLATPLTAGEFVQPLLPMFGRLAPALAVILAVGIIDDLFSLKPGWKLAGQLAAASLAFSVGVRIVKIAGVGLPGWTALPITLLWLVACSNAFNLIDGVDGLAAGAALISTCTIFVSASLMGNVPLALLAAPLAGSLAGFLRYNFNPATIFLGDSGSLFLGFLLGTYGVVWSQKSAAILGMTAPLMVMAVPLLDVALSIARRFLSGTPIFQGDHRHIHHRLLDRGLSPRKVALLLYACCGVAALLSLVISTVDNRYSGLVVALFCGLLWVAVRKLNYGEFRAAQTVIRSGGWRRLVAQQISLQELEQRLAACDSAEMLRAELFNGLRKLGFQTVAGNVLGEGLDDFGAPRDVPAAVEVLLRWGGGGWLLLASSPDGAPPHVDVNDISRLIDRILKERGSRPIRCAEDAPFAARNFPPQSPAISFPPLQPQPGPTQGD